MMPTFPPPPLKFRTAGFPSTSFKAGILRQGLPSLLVCDRPSCSLVQTLFPALCQGLCCLNHLRASGPSALPQGPSLRSGLFCPDPSTLIRPHPAPLAGNDPDASPTGGLYQMPSLCIFAMPRQPTTGSELSLLIFHNMSSSETTGNSSVAYPQFLHRRRGPSTPVNSFKIPVISSHRFW